MTKQIRSSYLIISYEMKPWASTLEARTFGPRRRHLRPSEPGASQGGSGTFTRFSIILREKSPFLVTLVTSLPHVTH